MGKGQHGSWEKKSCTSRRRKKEQTGKKKGKTSMREKEHTGYKGLHTSHTCFQTHMNIDFMKLEGRLGASVT